MTGRTVIAIAALLGRPGPAAAGPPFLSDDPEPTPNGGYEIYLFSAGAVAHGAVGGAGGVDFNYGAAPGLQLTAVLPLEYDHAPGGGTSIGFGNVELAAKWKFLRQEEAGVDVAFFPRVFLPSPSSLGDKHASFLAPLWIGWNGGGWSTFGGGGCALHRGGDAQDYCIVGAAASRRIAEGLTLGAELFRQTADVESGSASSVAGLGVVYDFGAHLHLLGYAGAGLERPADTGRAYWYASVLFTF
ncbi:MAG: transporter [Parvularculaceae bacterium]|nr:transporter [Parvularculaceae bacterium]